MDTAARAPRRRHLALLALLSALLVPSTASAAVGTLDASWGGATGSANAASNCANNTSEWCAGALAVQSDGKVLVAGSIRSWNNSTQTANRLFRIDTGGAIDATFPVVTVANDSGSGQIWTVALSPNGTIFVGGTFTSVTVDGVATARTGMFALTPTGQLTAFDISASLPTPNPSATGGIFAIHPTADGGVIAGTPLACGAYAMCRLARFDATGAHDSTFTGSTTATSAAGPVYAIVPAPGGGYYVGGAFSAYKGGTATNIVRISANGAHDTAFAGGANAYVTDVAIDASDRVLIAGDFTQVNGTNANGLARLNADGTLDTGFSATSDWGPQAGPDANTGVVWSVAVDATGRIWAGGNFASFKSKANETLGSGIVALNPDGTKDASVTTTLGTGASGWFTGNASWSAYYTGVRRIVPTGWGLYVSGMFNRFSSNSTQRNHVVRLESGLKQLTVVPAGGGSGSVASSPAGIACGASCVATFAEGSAITLTAMPAAGSTFTGWTGACTGTATTCTVTLTGNEVVTATFASAGSDPSPSTDSAKASASTDAKPTGSTAPRLVSTTRSGSFDAILRVRVPGAGTLRGVGVRTGGAKGIACRIPAKQVRRAGVVTLTCHLNAASRLLLWRGSLRVALTTTYTATGGTPVAMRSTATFRAVTPAPSPVTG